ncbi:Leucine zipper putative tumor suppressor 3 [Madurella mycetomatis]|uniref:Leucine zipper putative tumor suppressor 3 n=1 Tax=Madurella mycetomatis TaxID=100816 RepID=A0A175VTE5_9PEZI|nr:Leucine zipper putative tumor suppressor 3 [Madurella mycetomatis]KXX76352.1 Leucine zipper putative tumor suppressor 3 [Madurella mycetomatis]
MTKISKKETEIADFIRATDRQLADVNAKLGALCLAKQEQDEMEADKASAISQVAVEQTVLAESRKLLEELLSGIHTAAVNARKDQALAQVVNNFGGQNEGMQIGRLPPSCSDLHERRWQIIEGKSLDAESGS